MMRHLNENVFNLNSEQLHASEIRQIAAIWKFQINFEAQKEDSNIFVRYPDDESFVFCMRVFIVKNEGTERFCSI